MEYLENFRTISFTTNDSKKKNEKYLKIFKFRKTGLQKTGIKAINFSLNIKPV